MGIFILSLSSVIILFTSVFMVKKYRIANQKLEKAKSESDLAKLRLMLLRKELKTIVDLMSD